MKKEGWILASYMFLGERDDSRFSPDFEIPLSILGMEVTGDPNFSMDISCVQVLNERKQMFEGPEKAVLSDLLYQEGNMHCSYCLQHF